MSIALPLELRERLETFRRQGGVINVSSVCSQAIDRELERRLKGNRLVERLKVELTERRGPEWTAGYQEGRNWGEERANWREITEFASRYEPDDVQVKWNGVGDLGEPGAYEFEWLSFDGRFNAPDEDYGQDRPNVSGAPAYVTASGTEGQPVWEYNSSRCQRFWRGWLAAVKDVYAVAENHLPSVKDQLPPLREDAAEPDVNPDEIPF